MAMSIRFDDFCQQIKDILDAKSAGKGYNEQGAEGRNDLYDFIEKFIGPVQHAHALGEIVYKVVRYAKKQDPEDLEKIAAWAYLIYKHSQPFKAIAGKPGIGTKQGEI